MIVPEPTRPSQPARMRDWAMAWMGLAVLALVLCLPAIVSPPITYASFWIDHVWIDQFAGELGRGILYPRWLPQSHGGLGAPVFHYYAPIAFYVGAGLRLIGLTPYAAMLATFALAWFGSGVAMLHCLGSPRGRSLAGAVLYMVLPYHILDFYRRGALAEFCIYPLIPVLVMALRRGGEGRGFVPLAFVYAALLMTHLPMALVTSLFLILPYVLSRRSILSARLASIVAGLALGLALAAIYLVPALILQHVVSIENLWSGGELNPANWSFFTPDRWPDGSSVLLFVAITIALAIVALPAAIQRDRLAWWAILLCAVVAGAVPGLWSLPLLAKVQFPWRALVLVEFAVALALARSKAPLVVLAPAVTPALILSVALLGPAGVSYLTIADLSRHPDVLEYLPAGFRTPETGGTFSQVALDMSKRPSLVQRQDRTTVAHRFYNPAWEVTCRGRAVQSFPDPATRLLAWRGDDCTIRWQRPLAERIGCLLSLAGLIAAALIGWRAGAAGRPGSWRALKPAIAKTYAGAMRNTGIALE
jgi:hypothetical protein